MVRLKSWHYSFFQIWYIFITFQQSEGKKKKLYLYFKWSWMLYRLAIFYIELRSRFQSFRFRLSKFDSVFLNEYTRIIYEYNNQRLLFFWDRKWEMWFGFLRIDIMKINYQIWAVNYLNKKILFEIVDIINLFEFVYEIFFIINNVIFFSFVYFKIDNFIYIIIAFFFIGINER